MGKTKLKRNPKFQRNNVLFCRQRSYRLTMDLINKDESAESIDDDDQENAIVL